MHSLSIIKSLLSSKKEDFAVRFGVSEMGIFGSVTRKDFKACSDIDILVDFNRPIGIEFITLAEELELLLQWKVDLVSKRGLRLRSWEAIKEDLVYV